MINYLDLVVLLYILKEMKMILNSLNCKGDFLILLLFEEKNFIWEMIGFNKNDVIKVGEILVEIVFVDYDVYGVLVLLICMFDYFIIYIGDLCLYGYNCEEILVFCEKVKYIELLMMEGVSISFLECELDLV